MPVIDALAAVNFFTATALQCAPSNHVTYLAGNKLHHVLLVCEKGLKLYYDVLVLLFRYREVHLVHPVDVNNKVGIWKGSIHRLLPRMHLLELALLWVSPWSRISLLVGSLRSVLSS